MHVKIKMGRYSLDKKQAMTHEVHIYVDTIVKALKYQNKIFILKY